MTHHIIKSLAALALGVLIMAPTANARVSVGGLSALFLIQLPLSAAKLRRGGMVL